MLYVTIIIVNFFFTNKPSDESQTGVTELEMFDVYVYGPNSLFLRMMWLDYLDPNAILTTRSYTYPTSKKYLMEILLATSKVKIFSSRGHPNIPMHYWSERPIIRKTNSPTDH